MPDRMGSAYVPTGADAVVVSGLAGQGQDGAFGGGARRYWILKTGLNEGEVSEFYVERAPRAGWNVVSWDEGLVRLERRGETLLIVAMKRWGGTTRVYYVHASK